MKVRAAALLSAPGKYETIEVELEGPRQNEVLVRVVAAGLCHSDDHIATGDLPVGKYPVVGGHEGAGVVEEVGPNTTGVKAGDHIVFSFMPVCGRCRWCATGHQNLCDLGALLLAGSRYDDPTSYRMTHGGEAVGQMCGTSTFAEYTTVDVRSIVVIPQDIPLDSACLVGCGVITGWGSAVNAAQAGPGDVIIVMGVGGIGVNAVQGSVHSGAAQVIAVDPVPYKREFAISMGATAAFATIEEGAEYARSQTNGQGADSTIVTTGVTNRRAHRAGLRLDPQGRHRGDRRLRQPDGGRRAAARSGAGALSEAHSGCDLRHGQPHLRHPPRTRPLPAGHAQARRVDQPPVHPRRGRAGLRRHARGHQHSRCGGLLTH